MVFIPNQIITVYACIEDKNSISMSSKFYIVYWLTKDQYNQCIDVNTDNKRPTKMAIIRLKEIW